MKITGVAFWRRKIAFTYDKTIPTALKQPAEKKHMKALTDTGADIPNKWNIFLSQ